jgi:uncharacterized damage-inducible protein DinB
MLTKQDILEEFNEEVPATRKMLERTPFDKLDFKPNAEVKMFTLEQLAFMVASMPGWFLGIIKDDSIELTTYKRPPKPKDAKELAKSFDEGVKAVQEALSAMDDEFLKKSWALKMNGKVLMEASRGATLRQTINHLVHHRAQLGVYLKMLGVPHPAVYGASGDEQ